MLNSLFCVNLRTAGKTISWISIVFSLILTVAFSFILNEIKPVSYISLEDSYALREGFIYVISFCLTIALLNLLISIFLVLGIIKERHLLFLPWLICSGIVLTLGTFLNLFCFISSLVLINTSRGYEPLYSICIFIVLAFGIYIYCGIYSLYKQVEYSYKQKYPLNNRMDATAGYSHLEKSFVRL
ncbi:uncharacterized protein LOC117785527 [Drosophila innubila]|uniref:uncharacterized protein LOC117785527 n=1 Tax=Drosophila innubila TaxID=198719 RepID=UPI00148D7B4F|nr:uncharacterized protein LOC117785527 [Drosophila innubila]